MTAGASDAAGRGGGRPPLPPGPYLVVGLGRSGRAAALLLSRHGRVLACDTGPVAADLAAELGRAGVEVHAETSGVELLEGVRTVVKSPGVPRDTEVVSAARAHGLTVTGELEIAWRSLPNVVWAVTGTNGKTTTVELLAAILRAAGEPAVTAGNVGTPLAALVGQVDASAPLVVEASSFQIEDALAFAPERAVLVNLGVDHIDRHGSVEAYHHAKLRLFAHQTTDALAVAPAGVAVPGDARRVAFGPAGSGAELEFSDAGLFYNGDLVVERAAIALRGRHNLENAAAATLAALAAGVPLKAVRAVLAEFRGVPHRLEEVGRVRGVLYVNDSKATNVASTERALESFAGGIHLIAGGRPKGGGFRSLRTLVGERCRCVYAIGEAAEEIARDLDGAVPVEVCGTLERAVALASERAVAGEVVLLSPACASFDQFRDFEERGERFRALVAALRSR